MKSIDDLPFPPSGSSAKRFLLPWNCKLPNGVILQKGETVTLEHDGIFAYVNGYKF